LGTPVPVPSYGCERGGEEENAAVPKKNLERGLKRESSRDRKRRRDRRDDTEEEKEDNKIIEGRR
jgi:hypothetical protein